jgi:hypothetical protein
MARVADHAVSATAQAATEVDMDRAEQAGLFVLSAQCASVAALCEGAATKDRQGCRALDESVVTVGRVVEEALVTAYDDRGASPLATHVRPLIYRVALELDRQGSGTVPELLAALAWALQELTWACHESSEPCTDFASRYVRAASVLRRISELLLAEARDVR